MSADRTIAVDPETLLAHQGFLSGLARKLVHGDEQAEDYVQETLAYALDRPPRPGPGLRSWLSTALRNSIRQDRRARGRRSRRERKAARAEAEPPVEAARLRERTRRRVVDAVFALDEPYRSVVVLRYLDDLPPREVARRLGDPVETVRTRLRRALARLRKSLDDEYAGDRRAWTLALAPLIVDPRPAGFAGLLKGALVVSTKTKVAAVALLLLLVAGAALLVPDREPAPEPEAPGPEVIAEGGPDLPPPAIPPEGESREIPPPPEPDESRFVRIVFTDESGVEIESREARRLYSQADLEPEGYLVSDTGLRAGDQAAMVQLLFGPPEEWRTRARLVLADGGPHLETDPDPGSWRLFLARPGAAPILTRAFEVTESGEVRLRVTLPRAPELRKVRVVEAGTGEAQPGAAITPYFEYGDDQAFLPGPPVVTDGNGYAEIPLLEILEPGRSRQPTWWVEANGKVGRIDGWSLRRATDLVSVPVRATAAIEGRAWLSNGEPAVGREVVWTRKGRMIRTPVREDGTYRVAGVPVGSSGTSSERVVLVEDLAALKVGLAKGQVRPGAVITVDIGSPPPPGGGASISGRIRTGAKALPGVAVFITPPRGGDPLQTTRTDEEGRYRVDNLPTDGFGIVIVLGDMRASDDFLIRSEEPIRVGAGEERELSFDLPDGTILARVVDEETGEPVAGVVAWARPMDREKGRDLFPGFRYGPGWAGFTDEDGRVLLLAQMPGQPASAGAAGEGIPRTTVEDVSPGTVDAPAEVTISREEDSVTERDTISSVHHPPERDMGKLIVAGVAMTLFFNLQDANYRQWPVMVKMNVAAAESLLGQIHKVAESR